MCQLHSKLSDRINLHHFSTILNYKKKQLTTHRKSSFGNPQSQKQLLNLRNPPIRVHCLGVGRCSIPSCCVDTRGGSLGGFGIMWSMDHQQPRPHKPGLSLLTCSGSSFLRGPGGWCRGFRIPAGPRHKLRNCTVRFVGLQFGDVGLQSVEMKNAYEAGSG